MHRKRLCLYRSHMKTLIDMHTHTIMSGHAMNTLDEMVEEAQRRGLKLFGITEHGPAIPGTCDPLYFRNIYIVPRQWGDMRLMLGAELNIIDYEGRLDLEDVNCLKGMEYRIAGLHQLCYRDGNRTQNTAALIGAIENPWIHIISHPCDGTASDFDIEAVVLAAKRNGVLLELNSSSLNPVRHKHLAHSMFVEMLEWSKRYDNPILVSSDAHYKSYIADYTYALPLLDETHFPEELIVNDKPDMFLKMIESK